MFGFVPFLYSTNGEVIWFHDIRNLLNRSHIVAQFHTPEALVELLARDSEALCESLLRTPNDHPRLRPYQREANAAIEEAITGRKQQMLVAMATGFPLHLIVGKEDGTSDQIKFRLSDCVFEYGDFRDADTEDFGAQKFEGFLVVGSKNGDTLSLFEPKS